MKKSTLAVLLGFPVALVATYARADSQRPKNAPATIAGETVHGVRDAGDAEILRDAQKRVQAWLAKGGVKNTRKLHVIYFSPKDVTPFPDYRRRLDGVMRNIQKYYADQMVANGLPAMTFALDTASDGLIKIHLTTGEKTLAEYDIKGIQNAALAAAASSLKTQGIDIEKNHVVIFCNMQELVKACDRDNRPAMAGVGSRESGVSWVYDYPKLDIRNIDTPPPQGVPNVRGVSDDIGCMTHEMGHSFGLPHSAETPEEEKTLGKSLMGMGAHNYAEERRGEGKGTFINRSGLLTGC